MRQPAIFISHSSEPDKVQEELLALIQQALGNSFEILLDKSALQAGDRWRDVIHTWMAMCDTAIVLFSAGVKKEKDWVMTEVSILRWRQTMDRNFLFIPVFLPGFGKEDLAGIGLAPADVTEIQGGGLFKIPPISGDGTAKAIFEQVKPRLETLKAANLTPAPLRDRIDLLAGKFAVLPDTLCRKYTEQLTGRAQPWDPRVPWAEQLARAMLEAPLTKATESLTRLAYNLGRGPAEDVFELLLDNWVPSEAAKNLLQIAMRSTGAPVAILNSTREITGRHYIRQAFCNFPPGCDIYVVSPGFHPDIAAGVRRELREQYRRDYPYFDEQEIEALFEKFSSEPRLGANDKWPKFLLLDARNGLSAQDVRKLSEEFPRFASLVLSPPLFKDQSALRDEEAVFLVPLLEPSLETQVLLQMGDFRKRINSIKSGS